MQPDAFRIGAEGEARSRDEGLSPAALDVRYELEAFARLNPGLPARALVWHLARKWIPAWLKQPKRRHP